MVRLFLAIAFTFTDMQMIFSYVSLRSPHWIPSQSINTLQPLIWRFNKTEVLVIGPKSSLSKASDFPVCIDGVYVRAVPVIWNLGVPFDPSPNSDLHTESLARIAFYQLWNIAQLRPFLTNYDTQNSLVHAYLVLTIGIPFLLAFLLHLYKRFSSFRTLLPESSPITGALLTALTFSHSHTGYQFCPVSSSKCHYSPSQH